MTTTRCLSLLLGLILFVPESGTAQSLGQLRDLIEDLVEIPAISGHERQLAEAIADRLRQRSLSPDIDRMSNVTVTVGSGRPRRLIVANIDEPGYVVSGWTDDGYLRMNRVGLTPSHPYLDQYFEGQRLWIRTSRGGRVPGVTSIPSTHLRRGLNEAERPFSPRDAYVDIGAGSPADIQELGIRLMDPISLEKTFSALARDRVSGPFLADRVGAAALLSVLTSLPESEIEGTLTVAFVTQEHFGRKGIDRVSERFTVDEVFALEIMNLENSGLLTRLGTGIGVDARSAPGFSGELNRFGETVRDDEMGDPAATPRWREGTRVVRLGIPIMFHETPVEVLDLKDLRHTVRFLRILLTGGQS